MAVQIYKPKIPLVEGVRQIADDFNANLQRDTETQCIYPKEVYKGYLQKNAERARYHGKRGWYATGEGVKSLDVSVKKASNDNPADVVITISHLDYMKFAEMGVNMWTTYDEVQTSRKANYKRRYANFKGTNRARPVIMYGSRRLARRLANFMEDFYGKSIEFGVMQNFDDGNHPFELL